MAASSSYLLMARHAAGDLNRISPGKEFEAEVSLKREFEEHPT